MSDADEESELVIGLLASLASDKADEAPTLRVGTNGAQQWLMLEVAPDRWLAIGRVYRPALMLGLSWVDLTGCPTDMFCAVFVRKAASTLDFDGHGLPQGVVRA